MKMKIYDALKADPFIADKVKNEIKFYEYPPTDAMEGFYIVVDPLDVPIPGTFADNKALTRNYLYQIEVWALEPVDDIAEKISDLMWDLGFGQRGGIDEYDKDTAIFRQARRYEGTFYK